MAYNALNNLIDAYIYPNGVQAITGSILNNVLKAMVSQLGGGYNLMGVASPASSPAVNDEPLAYFAATAGTYTNFDGIVLAAGEVAVLLTSGNGSWSKQTIYNVPTGTADLANTAGFITSAVNSLVNYYTKTEIDTALAGYTTTAALATALADYYNKASIDAQMATRYTKSEVDTKLGEYYKKTETYDKDEVDSIVAALSRQEYIVAWDGSSAPDVSAIPAGVTVTYSGTTYTGTLAASASTVNKIYMVWNGIAYDMYATSQDGGYSWVPMGTTSVDLSQYATKAELGQLQQEINILAFHSVFSSEDIESGKYITNDGTIGSGVSIYLLAKFEIASKSQFFITGTQTWERPFLVKYTDSTYTTVDSIIIQEPYTSDPVHISKVIELDPGFYAVSWNTTLGTNTAICDVSAILESILESVPRPIIYDISCENIPNKYITDAGAIGNAGSNYRLGKFEITKAGKYYFGESIYDASHPTLAKFADSSYSGNGQILIDSSPVPIDGWYYLKPGFYALCGSNYQTIVVTYLSGIEKYLDGLCQMKHNFGGGITDFSRFVQNTAGTWTIVSKDKVESTATGNLNRIYFPVATYEDNFIASVVVTPKTTNNGNWEFVFGRDDVVTGTFVHIGQDGGGKFAAIYCANTLYQRYDLSALRMGVGRALSVVLEKSLDTLNFFNLTITDEAGNVFTQQRIVSYDPNTATLAAGLGYGPLTMYGITGTVTLEKLSFVYPKDANDIKLAVCGHSFVAGHNSTLFDQDKKFASLLANDIGLKNTCVFGLGGGGVGMIPALSLQLGWISTVRYVIIVLGANDTDTQATADVYQSFNDNIVASGAFPIWLTIPKLKDGTQAKPNLSQYIRDNFYFVDIDNIFVDENGDPIPSMYGDNIHPSIEGYRRMYEVIKNQCSFIFGV